MASIGTTNAHIKPLSTDNQQLSKETNTISIHSGLLLTKLSYHCHL